MNWRRLNRGVDPLQKITPQSILGVQQPSNKNENVAGSEFAGLCPQIYNIKCFLVCQLVFEDAATSAPAKAAAEGGGDAGSFTKLTHAAEAFASHAASQAAGLFSYHKVEEEKTQDSSVFFIVDTNWQSLCPVPCFPELFDTCTF